MRHVRHCVNAGLEIRHQYAPSAPVLIALLWCTTPLTQMRTATPLIMMLATALSTPVQAQREGILQQPGPAYCEAGFDWLVSQLTGRQPTAGPPDQQTFYRYCNAGDSIAIPPSFSTFAAKVCDFSQAVVNVQGGYVVCVVSPQRKIRTERPSK
jgi:hypothetical protein